jgi:hypothetical protein
MLSPLSRLSMRLIRRQYQFIMCCSKCVPFRASLAIWLSIIKLVVLCRVARFLRKRSYNLLMSFQRSRLSLTPLPQSQAQKHSNWPKPHHPTTKDDHTARSESKPQNASHSANAKTNSSTELSVSWTKSPKTNTPLKKSKFSATNWPRFRWKTSTIRMWFQASRPSQSCLRKNHYSRT